ncbi:sulfatase [Halosquirtibacter xylanolyticus]|uniref:sulfatase family protein n=1 Tax=Halosquirtibacter xylanolyticus TaxID=3374599 RepID=UPI003748DF7F|nr:sulfatase [Prolixibacteraceae bacterium]
MFRIDKAVTVGLSLISLVSCRGEVKKKSEVEKPNILYIMCDDHTANAISAYKGRYADVFQTPNIDRIAKDGVLFTNCNVTNSICTPSRATIMTGKYGHKTGVYTLWDDLDVKEKTFPVLLQKAGYETAIIGKWHLHTQPQGFDYYSVLPGQGKYFDPNFQDSNHEWEPGKKVKGVKYKGYATDVITDQCLSWLKQRDSDKPFFLMCHHKAPHGLWEYHPKYEHLLDGVDIPEPSSLFDPKDSRSKGSRAYGRNMDELSGRMNKGMRKKEYPTGRLNTEGMNYEQRVKSAYQKYLKDYLRTVASIDENVGRLLDYLETSGLAKSTVVVYTSDQGMFLGEHNYYDKRWMYDESLRMPLIVKYPQKGQKDVRNGDMITNLDFPETILDIAGIAIPSDMQGRSFKENLKGNTPKDWRHSMYYHYWMQIKGSNVPAHYGIKTDRYKLIYFYGRGLGLDGCTKGWDTPEGWELYDLKNDPMEMHNIYDDAKSASLVKQLKSELLTLKERYGDDDKNYPELYLLSKDEF